MKNQPHISPSLSIITTTTTTPISSCNPQPSKKRGGYSCGRCGLPKRGHVCHLPPPTAPVPPRHRQNNPINLRRALSFDDDESPEIEVDQSESDLGETVAGGLQASCLWEVMKRLPPTGLLTAAVVCRGWRDTTKRLWKSVEELRLRVPARTPIGFVNSILQKCPAIVRLNLMMESDVDATMLACIAFSCPNLEMIQISFSGAAVNWITGDELSRFVADKRGLTILKMEGCSNLGGFILSSPSLSTLWLSDLHSLSKMVFNCPNMKEISLEFSQLENDNTDLISMVDGLGRSCSKLQNLHVASVQLSHGVVLALIAANFRGLRMLSLLLGLEITDASVAAIATCYSRLELLDLSGSSISDTGIGMICNMYSNTMSRLLLALCPNITSSGIQFATAQLPLLELMDCGMTICDPNAPSSCSQSNNSECPETYNNKLHLYQKLIIKHNRLKKLSLWGCSGLDALYLSCPQLNDLNLNSCANLLPGRLMLQCPTLESVHASGCNGMLVDAIQSQVTYSNAGMDNQFPCKRLADSSKRVRVPSSLSNQPSNDNKKQRRMEQRQCKVLVD
ncbi:hypothetical protein ACFE04_031704 [Oxalis oulophora]